ncbi:MAG TPA: hypothetical protein VLC94_10090, partial [Candidatus Acidoferrum sp.]|nr:hypothetical protein [Candidatus Acidoferrum sp.]
KKVGKVIGNFKREIVPAVRAFLEHGKLEEMKRNVAAQHNRAVFEIPQFLATVLGENAPPPGDNPATIHAAR